MSKKFMIFGLASQRYGINLNFVREVIGLPTITQVPGLPAEFKGIINLRGRIIPLLALEKRLMTKTESNVKRATIIIAEFQSQQIGLLVDEVVEVLPIEESQIDKAIETYQSTTRDCVIGVAKAENKELTLILGMDRLINPELVSRLQKQNESVAS